jgi:predicted dehydrogenase
MRGWQELVVHMRGKNPEITGLDKIDIERAELEAFADAITGAAPYPMTYEEMAAVPEFLEAAIKSWETEQIVKTL